MKRSVVISFVWLGAMLGTFVLYNHFGRKPDKVPQPVRKDYAGFLTTIFPADTRKMFDAAQSITIYSLGNEDDKGKELFHGTPILGSTQLTGASADALRWAFYTNASEEGMAALCYFPHHGIRVQQGAETLDFDICFSCGQIYSYYGDKETHKNFSSAGREAFNNIYSKAGLKIEDSWP